MRPFFLWRGIALIVTLALGGAWYMYHSYETRIMGEMQEREGVEVGAVPGDTSFRLSSPSFTHGTGIPARYTCDGENVSPELDFHSVPGGTKSLVILMDDPDVPKELKPDGVFDHWVLFNIPPSVSGVPEGGSPGISGRNGAGKAGYTGPCPPPQYEPSEHRYFFRAYALDTTLDLGVSATKGDVLSAMEGHVLAEAELMGRYRRQ